MVERFGFVLSGCEPEPVRFLIFQSKLLGAPALEAIDEEPLRVAVAACREPPLVCLFRLSGCEPKPVRFLIFQSRLIGAPALEATDEEPLRIAAAACREPPSGCLFRLPGCEPKPVRFLIFRSRAGKGMLAPYALIFPTTRALAGSASPAW